MNFAKLERDTLALVNKSRLAAGLKALKRMPKGRRGRSSGCPLARGLNFKGKVGTWSFSTPDARIAKIYGRVWRQDSIWGGVLVCPDVFQAFVAAFDDGLFPHLVAK